MVLRLTHIPSKIIFTIMRTKFIGKGLWISNATPNQEEIPKVKKFMDDIKGLPLDGA